MRPHSFTHYPTRPMRPNLLLLIVPLLLTPFVASAQRGEMPHRDSVACGLTRAAFVLAAVDVCATLGARVLMSEVDTGVVTAEVFTKSSLGSASRLIVSAATDGRMVRILAYVLDADGAVYAPGEGYYAFDQMNPLLAALRRLCEANPAH